MHFEEQHRPASAGICMHGCSSACVTQGFCTAALLLSSCLIALVWMVPDFCVAVCVWLCVSVQPGCGLTGTGLSTLS